MRGNWGDRWEWFKAQEERLAALGREDVHRVSPWWMSTLRDIFRERPSTVVGRVGRRGGKSSTYCRLALAEATCPGVWKESLGDVPAFIVMSATDKQAKERVSMCAALAKALEIKHEPTTFEVRFPEHGTRIVALAATTRNAVSATSIGCLLDEMSQWKDDLGPNAAIDIIDLLSPALLTQPGAFMSIISAPWTLRDAHAQQYDMVGADRMRFHAATWTAHPAMTERLCRSKARTDEIFRSQYAAEPLDAVGGFAFAPSLIAAAMGVAA